MNPATNVSLGNALFIKGEKKALVRIANTGREERDLFSTTRVVKNTLISVLLTTQNNSKLAIPCF